MFSTRQKQFFAQILTGILIFSILVPTSIIARPFASDPEVVVYPENEILNFGPIITGQRTTLYFEVENNSSFTRSLQVTQKPSRPFSYNTSTSFNLAGQSSRNLPVTFEPNETGLFESSLILRNNETGESKILTVRGEGITSTSTTGISVSRNKVEFPDTIIGEVAQTSFIITNNSDKAENIYIDFRNNSNFTLLTPKTFEIPAKAARPVVIDFTPTDEKEYKADLDVSGANSRYRVNLKGFGIEANLPVAAPVRRETAQPEPRVERTVVRENPTPTRTERRSNRPEPRVIENFPTKLHIVLNSTEKTITEEKRSVKIGYKVNLDSEVKVEIKQDGQTVKTLRNEILPRSVQFESRWDGTNSRGNRVEDGEYTFVITAYALDTNQVETKTGFLTVDRRGLSDLAIPPRLSLTRTNINPDLSEVTYFNLLTFKRSDAKLVIRNPRTKQVVFTKRYENLKAGENFFKINWNGRNYQGNKVSEGKYNFELSVDDNTEDYNLKGTIIVDRTYNYRGEEVVIFLEDEPRPTNRTIRESNRNEYNLPIELPKNEGLITWLSVAPSQVYDFETMVKASFELEFAGSVSARILDEEKRVVQNVAINRPMFEGYKRNLLEWDTILGDTPVPNGKYYFEIYAASRTGEDADIVPFFIDRDESAYKLNAEEDFYAEYIRTRAYYPQEELADEIIDGCLNFEDVENNTEFCDAVRLAIEEGIFSSFNDDSINNLRPDDFLTRAEAITILLRVMGVEPVRYNPETDGNLGFKDLETTDWYMPYFKTIVKTAIQQNAEDGAWIRTIIKGYPDGTIRPNETISRAEFYKVFFEAAKQSTTIKTNFKIDYSISKAPFADTPVNAKTDWYLPYADLAAKLLTETNFAQRYFSSFDLKKDKGTFEPTKGVSRSEVIELLYELYRNKNIKF